MRTLVDRLLAWPQHLLPQAGLTWCVHRFARLRIRWLKHLQIVLFAKLYGIELEDAVIDDPRGFPDFNSCFTRALKPGARPLAGGQSDLVSPVDGTVSEVGAITDGRLLQAKGRDYRLDELLAGEGRAEPFAGGTFATLYLSPRDYHRIHMPLDGRLLQTAHVPGRLFAVNPPAVRTVPRLFARNERVITLFDTAAGTMALVLVGALFVAGIETVWRGLMTPPRGRKLQVWEEPHRELRRGEEMGRFNMGSTVILLFPRGSVLWDPGLHPGAAVRMGSRLGHLLDAPSEPEV